MTKTFAAGNIKLKRAYERAVAGDGIRILIDRLWSRGVKKADVAINQWIKSISREHDVAPMVWLRAAPLARISQTLRCGGPLAC